jgi:hypothetical protein
MLNHKKRRIRDKYYKKYRREYYSDLYTLNNTSSIGSVLLDATATRLVEDVDADIHMDLLKLGVPNKNQRSYNPEALKPMVIDSGFPLKSLARKIISWVKP